MLWGAERQGRPVVPGSVPGLGHLVQIYADADRFYAWANRKYGPSFWVTIPGSPPLLVVTGDEGFGLLRNQGISSAVMRETAGRFLGESLLVHDGPVHRRMRGAMGPTFTPAGLSAAAIGRDVARIVGPRMAKVVREGSFEVVREMRETALDVIFAIMGIETDELPEWRRQYEEFSFSAVPAELDLPGLPAWRGRRGKEWIDRRLRARVAEVRRDPDDTSLVASIVRGRDEQGAGMNEEELLDNLRLLALAGHETTASTMAWAVLHLGLDASLWNDLLQESTSAPLPPTAPADLKAFPVAEAIFREALRLHPPVIMDARTLEAPTTIHGVEHRPGTHVGVPILLLSRDPDHYERPDLFQASRWTGRKRVTPVEMVQFGGGAHFCLGYHVALLEGVQVLVTLARRCADAGLRPQIEALPRAVFMPFQKPRARTVRLVPA